MRFFPKSQFLKLRYVCTQKLICYQVGFYQIAPLCSVVMFVEFSRSFRSPSRRRSHSLSRKGEARDLFDATAIENFEMLKSEIFVIIFSSFSKLDQRYTYRVLQTIQMKLILLCVWAERAVLGSAKTALKFKYEI